MKPQVTPEFIKLVEDASSHRSCVAAARRLVAPGAVLVFLGLAGVLVSVLMRWWRPSSSRLSALSSPMPFGVAVGVLAVAGLAVRVFYVFISARHLSLGFDCELLRPRLAPLERRPDGAVPPVVDDGHRHRRRPRLRQQG